MTQNTGNRLAEQLGKNLSEAQVVSITQTIWQNQKDLISAIVKNIDKEEKYALLAIFIVDIKRTMSISKK